MMTEKLTGKKRYVCSFVKEVDGEHKPNVVVVAASNNVIARAVLVEQYGVLNVMLKEDHRMNCKAGIKSIRLAENNTFEKKEE